MISSPIIRYFPLLNESDLGVLYTALHPLSVDELRTIHKNIGIDHTGNKALLIDRLVHYIRTGMVLKKSTIPAKSCLRSGVTAPSLALHSLMLHGAYKNDARTRAFFKEHIGEHFHFTASLIDWLNERWSAGNPPTYQEYIHQWNNEYAEKLGGGGKEPKREWAYICFTQALIAREPNLSRDELMTAWHAHHAQQKQVALSLLTRVFPDHTTR